MRYIFSTFFMILLYLSNCNSAYASYCQIEYNHIDQATTAEYEDILSVVNCFNIYTSFFNNTCIVDKKLVSCHGESMDDALTYLQNGFSEEIAFRILDYFTAWDNESDKQIIISREGIPVFTEKDIKNCSFYIEDDCLTLQVFYRNCYVLGDSYIYYITAYIREGRLVINDLQWIENTSNTNQI